MGAQENIAAAQKAYTTLQQDAQQISQDHRRHDSVGGSSQTTDSSSGSALAQLLSSLGSAIQSGTLSTARAAYSTLSQDLKQVGLGAGTGAISMAGALSFLA